MKILGISLSPRLCLVIEALMYFRRDRLDPDNDVMYDWSLRLLQFNN